MNRIELIQSLVNQLNELPHRDEDKLDALTRRADMIIRRVAPSVNEYLADLRRIRFDPGFRPATEHEYNESWSSASTEMLNLLNTMLEELQILDSFEQSRALPQSNEVQKSKKIKLSTKIFVVHGHDGEMEQAVARTLGQLGLDPIILHEQPSQGRTIIEKFTDHSDVTSAVVLFSPDDMAYPKRGSSNEAKLRARQNVVFELGFFIGKLGRERVFVLHREEKNFEMLSDYSGVVYISYNQSGSWRSDLIKELKACGYDVDANKLYI